ASIWHSDRTGSTRPSMASLLHAIRIPDVGGDTLFANMYLAYDTLSAGMKKLIAPLYCIFPGRPAEPGRLARPAVAHPLVRRHPETGRPSLFIGELVEQFEGMTREESRPLLRFLCDHTARPQFCYRHRWQGDDLIVWDNRCTNHLAVGDYDKTLIRN